MYANYSVYKTLNDIENTYSSSPLDDSDLPVAYKYFKVIIRLYPVGVVFGGISMLANALLLWSYDSRNPYLAFPYLIWNIFMLLYTFGLTIFLVVIWNGIQYHFVVYTLYWLLSIYLIIVVYSYIQTLREDPSAFDIVIDPNVVVMQPAPYAKFP
ncbi:uncharacterized protein LOC110046157 isoform X2 [Orbicella faveolata]|nr:uncharacterized protein LOC110046157 isoform X2 [Orbicella faveolata]